MKLTDDVKQRKQKHFKQYRTAKQKLPNKENLVRFLHRGKPQKELAHVCAVKHEVRLLQIQFLSMQEPPGNF